MDGKEIQSKCWKEGDNYVIETTGIRYPKTNNDNAIPKFTKAKFKCRLKDRMNLTLKLYNLFKEDGTPLEICETERGLMTLTEFSIINNKIGDFEKYDNNEFFSLSITNIGVEKYYRQCNLGTIMFYIILKYVVDLCYKEFQISSINKGVYIRCWLSSAQKQFRDESLPFYINLSKKIPYKSLGYSTMRTCIYYKNLDLDDTKYICCYDSSIQSLPKIPEELESLKNKLVDDCYVIYHFQK